MADTFQCTIVTPDATAFDDEVTYVSYPAWDGQQGVMVDQSPFLARLGIGGLRIDRQGSSSWFWVDGGFAQVQDNVLTILTERARTPDELSADEAEKLLADANSRAVQGGGDQAQAEADQARGRTQLALARAGR